MSPFRHLPNKPRPPKVTRRRTPWVVEVVALYLLLVAVLIWTVNHTVQQLVDFWAHTAVHAGP